MNKISFILIFFYKNSLPPTEIFFNKNVEHYIYQALRLNIRSLIINKKKVQFHSPNVVINWRIDTMYTKEPDTLEWISKFSNKKNIIFWDIGANIGLYSIYTSLVKKKCQVYAFEPSFLNLYFLSKNIFQNNLFQRIRIIQLPIDTKKNRFLKFF